MLLKLSKEEKSNNVRAGTRDRDALFKLVNFAKTFKIKQY